MIPDREKVIKGLTICYKPPAKCEDCPYHDLPDEQSCNDALCLDALKLLKKQEAETKYVMDEYQPTCRACGFRPFVGYIPSLEWMQERGFKFCPQCGKAVKWDRQRRNHQTIKKDIRTCCSCSRRTTFHNEP